MSPKPIDQNTLFFGDNLSILREYIPTESVDLVYLDPPFNSNRSYNVLFKDEKGQESAAQIQAFDDAWHWDIQTVRTYHELVQTAPQRVVSMIDALHGFVGENQMMAYLVMMTARLVELHRVLKPTGSLYLHCDPTASHYLKIILDTIFDVRNFRNEIIWKRQSAHSGAKRWGDVHDTLLFYSKTDQYTWNLIYQEYDEMYIEKKYRHEDERGRFMDDNLTGAGTTKGDSGQPWRGYDPTTIGRHWAIKRELIDNILGEGASDRLTTQEKLDLLDAHGYIYWTKRESGFPRLKTYLGKGIPVQSVITDIPPINSQANERLGYPTQKPLALLYRIISASSNPGDLALDPFCGCGTAIAAAEKLGRRWIGIDITYLAINLVKNRLQDMYPDIQISVIGEPKDLADAIRLAQVSRSQFEWWAVSFVGGRPAKGEAGSRKGKKGSDRGIDGVINFVADNKMAVGRVLLQVKSGHIGSKEIRDLRGTLERENAEIAVMITLERVTREMRIEASAAGFYHSNFWEQDYPKLQIFTVEELLSGQRIQMPPTHGTYQKAPRMKKEERMKQSDMGI